MKFIFSIMLNLFICIVNLLELSLINTLVPIPHYDLSFGLSFLGSIVTLFIAQVVSMLIALCFNNPKLRIIPLVAMLIFWADTFDIMPHRSIVYCIISILTFSLYLLLLNRYIFTND